MSFEGDRNVLAGASSPRRPLHLIRTCGKRCLKNVREGCTCGGPLSVPTHSVPRVVVLRRSTHLRLTPSLRWPTVGLDLIPGLRGDSGSFGTPKDRDGVASYSFTFLRRVGGPSGWGSNPSFCRVLVPLTESFSALCLQTVEDCFWAESVAASPEGPSVVYLVAGPRRTRSIDSHWGLGRTHSENKSARLCRSVPRCVGRSRKRHNYAFEFVEKRIVLRMIGFRGHSIGIFSNLWWFSFVRNVYNINFNVILEDLHFPLLS